MLNRCKLLERRTGRPAEGASILNTLAIAVEEHPLLECHAFATRFPGPLGQLPSPSWLVELLSLEALAPMAPGEEVRGSARRLLRHGGFKPSGRSKPASEYLVKAAQAGSLGSINPAVDACNVVSLHSGIPISVVDLGRASGPFRVGLAPAGSSYVFNPSGQEIELGGLLCLFDAQGPCANAVKDCQRTKTAPDTVETLSVLWGAGEMGARTARAAAWYRRLLARLGAETREVSG